MHARCVSEGAGWYAEVMRWVVTADDAEPRGVCEEGTRAEINGKGFIRI